MSFAKDSDGPTPGGVDVPGLGALPTRPSPRGRRLKNLKLDRVDLVHAPANQHARVKLFKEEGMELDEIAAWADVVKAGYDFKAVNARVKQKDDGTFDAMHEDGKQVLGNHKDRAGAVKHVAGTLEKSEAAPAALKGRDTLGGMNMPLDKSKLTEPVRKHLEDLEASDPDAATALTEALAATQAAPAEDLAKGEYAKLEKALADERDARAATEARIAKMEADAARQGFVSIAKADLETLGKSEDVGAILFEANSKMDPEVYKQLEQVLKGAAARLADTQLFKQLSDGGNDAAGADEVHTLAKSLVDAGKANTMEQATIQVLTAHPELYRQYRDAQ